MEDNGIRVSGISARLHDSTYTPAKPKSPFFVFCVTVNSFASRVKLCHAVSVFYRPSDRAIGATGASSGHYG